MRITKETNIKELFKKLNLKEHSYYLIECKVSKNNVEHKSILFTGFNTGAYCMIYNNSYDFPLKLKDFYSIKIIKKLS